MFTVSSLPASTATSLTVHTAFLFNQRVSNTAHPNRTLAQSMFSHLGDVWNHVCNIVPVEGGRDQAPRASPLLALLCEHRLANTNFFGRPSKVSLRQLFAICQTVLCCRTQLRVAVVRRKGQRSPRHGNERSMLTLVKWPPHARHGEFTRQSNAAGCRFREY